MDDLFGPRQRTLFEAPRTDDTVSAAEACVLTLTERFAREYQERGSPDRVPPELDLAARACLYVCAQHPVPASPALLRGIDACRECLKTFSLYRHLDALPFELCRWLVEKDEHGIPFPMWRPPSRSDATWVRCWRRGIPARAKRCCADGWMESNWPRTAWKWISLTGCRSLWRIVW